MALRRWALAGALLFSNAGCETPDDDDPANGETISIGRATLGEATSVHVAQRTDEWEVCHPRAGEFGPWIDCEETRERAAHLVSIDCTPAEACSDVMLNGANGTFVPRQRSIAVKVIADIEGVRVEREQRVEVELPDLGIHFQTEHAFVDTEVALCRTAGMPEVEFTTTLDGAPIDPAAGDGARPDCLRFVPVTSGTLRAEPRLREAAIDLEAVSANVHSLSDAEDVSIFDQFCPGGAPDGAEVGAYADPKSGRLLVSMSAIGMLATSSSSRQSASLPASRMRLVVGGKVVTPERHLEGAAIATFLLDAPPPAGSRGEIDLDGRIVSAPLRAKRCD